MSALGPARTGACLVEHLWWFVWPEQVTSIKNKSGAPLGLVKTRTVLRFRMSATKIPINDHIHACQD